MVSAVKNTEEYVTMQKIQWKELMLKTNISSVTSRTSGTTSSVRFRRKRSGRLKRDPEVKKLIEVVQVKKKRNILETTVTSKKSKTNDKQKVKLESQDSEKRFEYI